MADRCKSCTRPVIWARNDKTGKAAPIDLAPDPGGNIVLLPGGCYRVLTNADREAGLDPATELHTSHWQTCVDREAWKGATKR